ncbi:MAG: sulfotransferase [Okeania sp. SIO1H6]|nr:sulfotransferase [Okeania sp. SIO1H6]
MRNKVLFILGTPACGSTLLSLMLDSHPQCFTVGELSNLPRLYQNQKIISFVKMNIIFGIVSLAKRNYKIFL